MNTTTPPPAESDTPRDGPGGARIPAKTLFAACICGTLWHTLVMAFGWVFFEPPKLADPPRTPQEVAARIIHDEAAPPVGAWYHWDALWIVDLSRSGYGLRTDPEGRIEQSNIAFTPGLAVVAAAADRAVGHPWSILAGFNLAMAFVAMLGLGAVSWRLTRSRSAMVWAIVALNAWPWRFFFVAPYQEAAGAAFCFWGLYAASRGRVVWGLSLSTLAAVFRLNAVGLFGGFLAGGLIEWLRGREPALQVRRMVISSGALIGWGLLLAYFQRTFGDAGLGVKIQSAWGRQPPHLSGLFESLAAPALHRMTGSEWLDWAAAWALLAAIPLVYRSFGFVWASSLGGLIAQALATGRVLSFGRFALLACPFFVVAGSLATRMPRLAAFFCAMGLAAQMGLAWRYGHDLFAG